MVKHNSHKTGHNKRCMMSNRLVGNKEVILTDHAIDYVRKMGYEVKRPNYNNVIKKLSLVVLMAFVMLIPMVSAFDLIENKGSFDTIAQYDSWDKFEYPNGTNIHNTTRFFSGGGSLQQRYISNVGHANMSAIYNFTIGTDLYMLELNCFIDPGNAVSSRNSCFWDEVNLDVDEFENVTLQFAWRKQNFPTSPALDENTMKVYLHYPNNTRVTLYSNSNMTFDIWNGVEKDVTLFFGGVPLIETPSVFSLDLDSNFSIFAMFILFALAMLFFFIRMYEFTAFTLIIGGFIFLFNGVNPVVSFVIITLGVVLIFYKGENQFF